MKHHNILKRILASVLMTILLASPPACASVSKEADTDTEPATIVQVSPSPVPAPSAPIQEQYDEPFSVVGNGEVLDDISDGSKEFYTITTRDNNTFFIVIDKASTSQNVYMLAKVDEDDLAEFIENPSEPTPSPTPTILLQPPTPAPTLPVTAPAEPEPKAAPAGSYAAIGLIVLFLIAGMYYFKVYKPKKEALEEDDEGMEYDDSDDAMNDED